MIDLLGARHVHAGPAAPSDGDRRAAATRPQLPGDGCRGGLRWIHVRPGDRRAVRGDRRRAARACAGDRRRHEYTRAEPRTTRRPSRSSAMAAGAVVLSPGHTSRRACSRRRWAPMDRAPICSPVAWAVSSSRSTRMAAADAGRGRPVAVDDGDGWPPGVQVGRAAAGGHFRSRSHRRRPRHAKRCKLWLLHQANARILDAATDSMGMPRRERVVKHLDRYGNTSAAFDPDCVGRIGPARRRAVSPR